MDTKRSLTHFPEIEQTANKIPVEAFLQFVKEGCVVFTGAGVGGSIATLATIKMLNKIIVSSVEEDKKKYDDRLGRVKCITFGALLVATEKIKQVVNNMLLTETTFKSTSHHSSQELCNIPDTFHHFVHEEDYIPRLLCMTETIRVIMSKQPDNKGEDFLQRLGARVSGITTKVLHSYLCCC